MRWTGRRARSRAVRELNGTDAGMKANRAFHLIVARGGREPAFIADRRRLGPDRGGIGRRRRAAAVLGAAAKQAVKLLKRLRADLAGLEAEEFLALWEGADGSSA